MGVISRAKEDPRLTTLLSELSGRIKLKYQKSAGQTWGSALDGQRAVVSYHRCKEPAAALCHELLHLELQLRGYRRVKIGFSTYEPAGRFFSRFLTCVDNELQHHKFYPRFVSLGFRPESFYCDADVHTEEYLRHMLKQPVGKLIEVLPDFFTLIAPGGIMAAQTKMQLLELFFSINDGQFRGILERIKGIVDFWASSDSLDDVAVYKEIMLVLQPTPNYSWFGFDVNDRPPTQGFFVDQMFEVDDR